MSQRTVWNAGLVLSVVLAVAAACGPAMTGGDEAAKADQLCFGQNCEPVLVDDGLCIESETQIRCRYDTAYLDRDVHYALPDGNVPAGGWPLMILYQGSFIPAVHSWAAAVTSPFGGYHQTRTIAELLRSGVAVLTPNTRYGGDSFWQTNVPKYASNWEASNDHAFLVTLFQAVTAGTFGPLSSSLWHAGGISSGGYMTSRMAVSYPGKFRSLVIVAASYATCAGAVCNVPAQEVPGDHPPTLFLHGANDLLVPVGTMEAYAEVLEAQETMTRVLVDENAGHAWISAAPKVVPQWVSEAP